MTAVTLGGSRAEGTHRPDSDWDFSVYYRGHFDPQTLRDIGWPGEVFEVGGWSPGVFNGGAWLEIDGRRTDVHYRDLDVIDREIAASREGRFSIEPLHVPPRGHPVLPGARGAVRQAGTARRTAHAGLPARAAPAGAGNLVGAGGRDVRLRAVVPRAAGPADPVRRPGRPGSGQSAHAVLAARGEWVTNEKTLLTRAGLREVDELSPPRGQTGRAARPGGPDKRDLPRRATGSSRVNPRKERRLRPPPLGSLGGRARSRRY